MSFLNNILHSSPKANTSEVIGPQALTKAIARTQKCNYSNPIDQVNCKTTLRSI